MKIVIMYIAIIYLLILVSVYHCLVQLCNTSFLQVIDHHKLQTGFPSMFALSMKHSTKIFHACKVLTDQTTFSPLARNATQRKFIASLAFIIKQKVG